MHIKRTLALSVASLILVLPFSVSAQSDGQMEAQFNKQAYMSMADKDGTVSKADVMKVVGEKFDNMATNGRMPVDKMGALLRELYRGGSK